MPPIYLQNDRLNYKRKPSLFNPDSAPILGSDPYVNNVVLLLRGEGASIIDSSPTPKVISVLGNTQISAAQKKYGQSSILFDGNGDYLTYPYSVDFTFDRMSLATLECWIYFLINPTTRQTILTNRDTGTGFLIGTQAATGKLWFTLIGAVATVVSDSSLQINTWHHLAVTKNGNVITLFIDGIKQSGAFNAAMRTNANASRIGGFDQASPAYYFNGYIAPLRLTAIERYTANFNPETDTFLAY